MKANPIRLNDPCLVLLLASAMILVRLAGPLPASRRGVTYIGIGEPVSMEIVSRSKQLLASVNAATVARPQTPAEEIANSFSHALGLAAVVAAGTFLLVTAAQQGNRDFIVGASIYVATMAMLYLASTLYHGLPVGRAKSILLVCDHSAIYLFIAGSFTPFALGVLRGPWALALALAVWALALAGVSLKVIFGPDHNPTLSTGLYVGMGWVLLLALLPVWHLIPTAGIWWLLAGGLAYTAGVAFFRAEQVRYAHFVWHLFVLAGTACHFIAILRFAS